MVKRGVLLAALVGLFFAATPLSHAAIIASQTDDSVGASLPLGDFIADFEQTYTYYVGTGFSGQLQDLSVRLNGHNNKWLVTFYCRLTASIGSATCADFGGSGGIAMDGGSQTAPEGLATSTATWSGTNIFQSDKHYFLNIRFEPEDGSQFSISPEMRGSTTSPYTGECIDGTTTFCTLLPDPYFILNTVSVIPPDTTPPVITISAGPAEGAHASSTPITFSFSTDDATASTTCAFDGLATSTCSSSFASSTIADGAHTFAVIATDSAGNAASTTRTFIVDKTAPVIAGTPADILLEATAASTTVSYTLPTALDAVEGSVVVSCIPASGSGFSLGSTTVVCSTQDSLGNATSSLFVVGVRDTTAPVVSLIGSSTLSLDFGASFADPGATAADLGTSSPIVTTGSVDTASAGTYTLRYTATDASGNSASTTRTVIVSAPPPPPPTPPSSGGGGGGGGNGQPVENDHHDQGEVKGAQDEKVAKAPEYKEIKKDDQKPAPKPAPEKKPETKSETKIEVKTAPAPAQDPWKKISPQPAAAISANAGPLPVLPLTIGAVLLISLGALARRWM